LESEHSKPESINDVIIYHNFVTNLVNASWNLKGSIGAWIAILDSWCLSQ